MNKGFDYAKVKFWVDNGYICFHDEIKVNGGYHDITWIMNDGGWVAWLAGEVIHETYENSVPQTDTIYRVRLEASRMIKEAK